MFITCFRILSMCSFSSVASFWYWGGGGGARPPNVYTGEEKKIMYICNLYARASALERYIFSGLMHIQSMQFPFITYGAINDSILTKH